MRRLLRWTFSTLAAASLLLCLATAGLWVRSYWVYDEFIAHRLEAPDLVLDKFTCIILSYRGHFAGSAGWAEKPEDQGIPRWRFQFDQLPEGSEIATGFELSHDRGILLNGYHQNDLSWAAPYWSFVSAFALLPAVVAFRQIRAAPGRRHRSRLGLCSACGYDLRATPGRCPECGREQGAEVRSPMSEVSEGVLDRHPIDL